MCVRRLGVDEQKQQYFLETKTLNRKKELADRVGINCLRQATKNGALHTAITQCLNGTELSKEKYQDNLLL